MIAVVMAVGNDDVIHELEAHDAAGVQQALGQLVVLLTGFDAA